MSNDKAAFTLAEVLITLGIIGVVAALTIPNLITSYKIHVIHKKLLKSYSVIQQVDRMMRADDLDAEMYMANSQTPYSNIFKKYLTGASDCKFSIAEYYRNSEMGPGTLDDGCLVDSNGIIYMFENMYNKNILKPKLFITVDINGYNVKPNRVGVDLFMFQYVNGGFKTAGSQGTASSHEWFTRTYKVFNDPNYVKEVLKTLK